MLKKTFLILIIILLAATSATALEYKDIEIFDINKGVIVKSAKSNPIIQKQALNYLEKTTNIYCKFKPIPDKGYMIKIPLEPPLMVKNQWFNGFADEIIIIFPEHEKPYLMLFGDEDSLLFFTFKSNTNVLLKALNFELNVPQ